MNTLLMLGGSDIQVHAIERARELGLRVVTCDNRPDNPGHRLAHEYHEVSTTDLDGVLDLAQRLSVDGVIAYASDPAALTAAYVSEQMGLPGDPFDAVRRAQDKLLLREVQRRVDLPAPRFVDASDESAVRELRAVCPTGIVVKPTDSSGSKGVTVIRHGAPEAEFASALKGALTASRAGRVIAEQVWAVAGTQIGGDVLVWQGEVIAASFGDQKMSPVAGSRMPIGTLFPSQAHDGVLADAQEQLSRVVSALGLRQGVYNFEFLTDDESKVALIDFGARIGGNLLGIVHRLVLGLDMVTATIRMALGESPPFPERPIRQTHAGNFALHSQNSGVLESIEFSDTLRSVVNKMSIAAKPGDAVRPYRTSANRLGSVVIANEDRNLLESIYRDAESHMGVRIRESQ